MAACYEARALAQWAALGTPFDVASYASAITAVITFIVNVVVPRLQPVVKRAD